MDLRLQSARAQTRRQFLKDSQAGLGALALSSLLGTMPKVEAADNPLAPRAPQFAAKAKHVIYLHMSGAPPQQDLFEYKPKSRGIPSCSARHTSSSSTASAALG